MILVTVGTHNQSFDRLIIAADELAKTINEEIIIQTGYSSYQCKYAKFFNFCPKEKMTELINKADIIIMQGGWGAMCEAIDKRKRIIAVPRIEGVEHIHDQEQVVRKLESLNCIIGVYDIKNLSTAVEKARNFNFMPLVRGNASIICKKINEWFS